MAEPPKIIEQLRGYDPAGTPVTIGFRGMNLKGWVLRQLHIGGRMGAADPNAPFLVELKEPIAFEEYTERAHISGDHAKALYDQLRAYGCIDEGDMVRCLMVFWSSLAMGYKRLAYTEYTEHDPKTYGVLNWPGRMVGQRDKGRVILLEVFDPVAFVYAPDAIASDHLEPGFFSSETYAFGIDTYRAWSRVSPETLPPGELFEKEKEYRLEEPIPVEAVERFCQEHFPEQPMCVYQCLYLFIIPIDTVEMQSHRIRGAFRPLRKELTDMYFGMWQVEYEPEGESEEFEIT